MRIGILKKIEGLLEKNSFIIIVIILNCAVLSFLVGYLATLRQKDNGNVKNCEITTEKHSDYSDKDLELNQIYFSLLEGAKFNTNGLVFSFGVGGKYEGYFDSSHKNVKDFQYQVDIVNDDVLLNIFDKNESQMVSYNMSFDKNGDILLKRQNMKTIKLKFQ